MKPVSFVFIIVSALLTSSCSTGGPELVHQEPAKTVYKSADESVADAPAVIPPRQKVPGE